MSKRSWLSYLTAAFFLLPSAAIAAKIDSSGYYASENASAKSWARLSIMFGETSGLALLDHVFGKAMHNCACAFELKKISKTSWACRGDDLGADKKLTIYIKQNSLEMKGDEPECCGAWWPGATFSIESGERPKKCAIASKNAKLFAIPTLFEPPVVDKTLSKDEPISVLKIPQNIVLSKQGYVLIKSLSDGTSIGLVKKADISCSK